MSTKSTTSALALTNTNGNTGPPLLDITKLHELPTEQQDLFLLTFVSDLRQHAENLSADALPGQQAAIKKEVIKIVGLSTPVPSRVTRQTLGRILADIFERGSGQLLHETINELLSIVNAGKQDKDLANKHVAVTCLGFLFRSAGGSAVSLSALVSSSLIRLIKSANNHVGFRASIVQSLGQFVQGLGPSIDEQNARDIWKQVRSLATVDKSALVQARSCDCLKTLVLHTPYFLTPNDFESIKAAVWKVLESKVALVRKSAAAALAQFLVQAYTEHGPHEHVPVLRKPKKSKKSELDVDEGEEEDRPNSAVTVKSSVQLTLTFSELLRAVATQYCKSSVSNRARTGLAMCYKLVLEGLPEKVVQDQYTVLADHLFLELIDHPTISNHRYRVLLTRKIVHTLLSRVVATTLLPENGQINAARWLINDVLKNYPKVIPGRREPSKRVLVAALQTLSHLLDRLGPASSTFQDSCREALFQCLQHPSYSVQVHSAFCFRMFVRSCPQQLARSLDQALSQVKKDLDVSGEVRSHRRAIGRSMSIAAMLTTARGSPLYGSIELFSNCFVFATDLLKNSATSELRLCATQVQVAWTIIGGLMTLGSSFAKVHMNQLLLLWRNASPPPLTQENASRRSQLELSFLSHVRECALTALLTFLRHNSSLITIDGSKRISSMLRNSVLFLNSLPNQKQTEDVANRLVPALQLQDLAMMLRRRVLQCMTRLLSLKHVDHAEVVSQSDAISLTVQTFVYPEQPTQKSLETALASSASTFEGLWDLGDNWGHGVNTLLRGYEISLPALAQGTIIGSSPSTMEAVEYELSYAASSPILPAMEHDAAFMYADDLDSEIVNLVALSNACVNAAIQLFAVAFPIQPPRVQESCIEQLATTLAQPMQREPGRKASLQVNIVTALVSALAVANGETSSSRGKFASFQISRVTAEMLLNMLADSDDVVRYASAQAMGRLCNIGGSQVTTVEVKQLIDTIVANRDPNARAGCALALGQVHGQVGAMAASFHLKTIVGVLLSLCSDSHPVVHFWALEGLATVAESAGLSFSGYVSSTLGLLARLYSDDTFNDESLSLTSSNAELEHSTPLAISLCVDSMINVLGPDLQDVAKTRNLILTLLNYFQLEEMVSLQVQSYVCLGHISLYAPAHVQLTKYVHDLQAALISGNTLLEGIAIAGIDNLMKRSASEVLRVSKPGLGDDLWTRFDKSSYSDALRNILRTWMQQTCLQEAAEWVLRCQTVLSRTRLKSEVKAPVTSVKSAAPDLIDDEVAGLSSSAAVGSDEATGSTVDGQEFLRWQTRGFAMELLSEMLSIIQGETLPDQIVPAEAMLQKKVADIVRVAFSASTAVVIALRLWGLRIIDQVLEMFGKTPDPDFLEASLLEQYQAQIGSALTPAFAADSTPELAAAAVAVCATFVATGIVTNVDRMGRIFRVLSGGLEKLALPASEASIGDLKDLSSNAQSMLKMALLSGWAQLQLASSEQPYLEGIVQPFVPRLAPLWLASLQEFAALRFEPEISNTLGGEYTASNVQERYGAFDREVRLRFYQERWLNLVDAIALLVEKDSGVVFDALDNKSATTETKINGAERSGKDMSFREEPVAFFFILFGLAYEALVTQARESPSQALAILNALKKILTPAVSGSAIYQDIVFTETTDTLDRLALTSGPETQAVLVEIARNLSIDHVVAKSEARDDKLSDDIDQLFELTRIIILVLVGLLPTLEDPPGVAYRGLTDSSIALVHACFQALVDVSEVFPSVIRGDLHACILHCYCTMLATGICQNQVIPQVMPVFRSFLQDLIKQNDDETTSRLIRGGLARMLQILDVAQRRENEYSLTCAKNTLLSLTVLLSTAGSMIPQNDAQIHRTTSELLDCLQDVGLAKVAASCIRTLLMTSPRSACDEVIVRLLWPRLLWFVNDPTADDPEIVKSTLMQALTASVTTLREEGRYAAMSVLIPSLLGRSQQTTPKGSRQDLSKDSAMRLLELAAADGRAFRTAVSMLADEERSLLENLLRAAGLGGRQDIQTDDEEASTPAIALRMDF